MGLDKKGYYTLNDILEYHNRFNIIYGQRAPGKSYAVKKRAIEYAWETGKISLAYIRRYKEDITSELVSKYFDDKGSNIIKDVTKIYDHACYFRGYIYFAKWETNENGELKEIRGNRFGERFALNLCQRYKSTGHPELKHFIFEEFVSEDNKPYLKNEPTILMNLLSTLTRHDDNIEVYMIGNTISRVCPYFKEWSLTGIKKQKHGTIDIYKYTQTDGTIINISVEYSPPSPHKNKTFFGSAEKSIQGGAWECDEFPKLEKDFNCYEKVYELTYKSNVNFSFTLNLLIDKESGFPLVYIYPAKHICERILTNSFYSSNIFLTPTLNKNNPAEVIIHNCFYDNKIFYSDNLTGQDFNDCLKSEIRYPF